MKVNTAGTWDPADRHIYFLAASLSRQQWASVGHGYVLLAVNDLNSDSQLAVLDKMIEDGVRVLLDSGIFWLTNEHKRKHGLRMDQALALPPESIEGFDWLWDRYLSIMRRYGDSVWGYIELDQGGRDRKRETRGRLHDLGLRPIPVYHPLNDGWDYFDELAETGDRICWGNVVQADRDTRRRFLQTCWERHRAYPDLWVHMLGLTPNQWLNSYPVDSADSSTWLGVVRWNGVNERAMMRAFSPFEKNYQYVIGDTSDESTMSDRRSLAMSAVTMSAMQMGWRHWQNRVEDEMGLPLYPAAVPGEAP